LAENLTYFGKTINRMKGQTSNNAKYQFLYKFLPVLDGQQVHKLYKIVAGLLDVSMFTKDEIEHLERRLSMAERH
jgi:hypothetical protein